MSTSAGTGFDLERAWQVHEQVALRPERFGAMAYHFGTRRLTFLKTRKLVAVVHQLDLQPTGRDACTAAGVSSDELPAYEHALGTLAGYGMLTEREHG